MRGSTHKILARTDGRRRTSMVTRTTALGSTLVAVVLGMGLPGHTSASTAAPSAGSSAGTAGLSAGSTSSRSTLRAPTTTPTSTTKRAHVRSGGS
jgi:hypothetical protein